MQWFIYGLRHSFDFKGRATRSEFWWFWCIDALLLTSLAVLHKKLPWPSDLSIYFFTALCLLPARLAVATRRLHDTGESGWLLIWLYVLAALAAAGVWINYHEPADVKEWGIGLFLGAGLLHFLMGIVLFLYMLGKSDAGSNSYGAPSLSSKL